MTMTDDHNKEMTRFTQKSNSMTQFFFKFQYGRMTSDFPVKNSGQSNLNHQIQHQAI